jgi:thiol:disulfide interchange protein
MILDKGKILLIFKRDWCQTCKNNEPVENKICDKLKDIKVYWLKAFVMETIANRYKVTVVPTYILLNEGKEIGRMIGKITEKTFKEFLR